jgi:hypothetical protein
VLFAGDERAHFTFTEFTQRSLYLSLYGLPLIAAWHSGQEVDFFFPRRDFFRIGGDITV